MKFSLLLIIIGVCGMVMSEPVSVAVPAVPREDLSVEPIVDSAASKPADIPVHLLPLKLETQLGATEMEELGIDADDNTPSHQGEAIVEIDGDVNLEINILAGLEADAAQTASGELTSFDGASEEEIKSIVEGVVDEQDLDAFEGISDADIDADGESMEAESMNGKEEEEDKAEHEKEEKKEEEKKEQEHKSEDKLQEKEKEKEKDVTGQELEIEDTGIKVENPVNHGEVTLNYVENLNLNLRTRNNVKTLRGLHDLARKLRLMKKIVKWFRKPVHQRLALLQFAKYHKIRVLELKLRLMKLKLLSDAIKMLRLAQVITAMKVKGDLTKMAIAHALYQKFRHPIEDVKTEEKSTIANRLAKIRAYKNLLRARRLARFRSAPIRREYFPSSPIVSSPSAWQQTQFMTSPIVTPRPQWMFPASFVTQPIISSSNPYHLLPLRGVDINEVVPSEGIADPQEGFESGENLDNEGLFEDLQLQYPIQHPLQQFPSHFETAPIIQHPYNIMLAGEGHPDEPDQEDY